MRALLYPLRFFAYLFSFLPYPVIYGLSDLLYLLLYKAAGYRKTVVRSNLQMAFPEKSQEERDRIEQQFYRHLCDIICEFLKIPSMSASQLKKRFVFLNPEVLEQVSSRGAIGISSHMCNWEWGALGISYQAANMTCLGVYKPLANKTFDIWFRSLRSRFGMVLVPMKSTYRMLKIKHPKPILLNLISDQTPTRSETEYEAPFLGLPTPVFLGPEKIAAATGMPVLYFAVRRARRGHYTVTTIPIEIAGTAANEAHALTNAHLALLENEIRMDPGSWLWSHRRWKHSGKSALHKSQSAKV